MNDTKLQAPNEAAGAASALDDGLGGADSYLNHAATLVPPNFELRITLECGEVRVIGINQVGGVMYVKHKFKDGTLSPTGAIEKAISLMTPNA